ncbi:MAG TPA: LemA family protein [Planctomycetota bacterium]|nr:LemA family protein [Planctomycetota bacterium]
MTLLAFPAGWIALIAVVLVAFWFVGLYNGLVRLKNIAKEAWAQIDVQLKRRHDLIPNLVETAKGYMKHERETLERVIQARNAAVAVTADPAKGPAAVGAAENMLTGALRQFFALSEAYPDLKANQNMLKLQEELTSTENRIAFSRQHYNDSVRRYNTKLEQVPTNMVKNFGDFPPMEFFELENPAEREAPKVSF